MAFHLACYNNAVSIPSIEITSRAFAARPNYSATPSTERCSYCQSVIQPGEMISFMRRGGKIGRKMNRAPRTTPTPIVDIDTPEIPDTNAHTHTCSNVDLEAVIAAVTATVEARIAAAEARIASVQQIEVVHVHTGQVVGVGRQHRMFPTLLKMAQARCNVLLVGSAASGKTTAASTLARALDLPYKYVPAFNDEFKVTGYNDATGNYIRTMTRDVIEFGGVVLIDEIDACDPNAACAINALLGNDEIAFPDGMVKKHPDCVIIAAANTYGHGATPEYVGRNKLDSATLDRFAVLEWPVDEDLEMAIAPNKEYCARVQECRKNAACRGLKVLITPRATIEGGKLLAAGLTIDEVDAAYLRKGMPIAAWEQIKPRANTDSYLPL